MHVAWPTTCTFTISNILGITDEVASYKLEVQLIYVLFIVDFISGEFGVVYKAHLQWHLDGATEVVAVKTLKGISLS